MFQSGHDYRDFFDLQQADVALADRTRRDFLAACDADLAALGVPAAQAAAVADDLYRRMSEPARHYHTPVHVMAMFCHADRAGVELRPAERLAVWFHDAVYDITAPPGANERASAEHLLLALAGRVDRRTLDDAATIILATARHLDARVEPVADTVMDLDLAGMAAAREVFERQSAAVRAEAPHVRDADYRAAVVRFFTALLDRDRLYRTPAFAPFEPRARQRLADAIDRLGAAV